MRNRIQVLVGVWARWLFCVQYHTGGGLSLHQLVLHPSGWYCWNSGQRWLVQNRETNPLKLSGSSNPEITTSPPRTKSSWAFLGLQSGIIIVTGSFHEEFLNYWITNITENPPPHPQLSRAVIQLKNNPNQFTVRWNSEKLEPNCLIFYWIKESENQNRSWPIFLLIKW